MFIAVNRAYGKSDYIPCICWGRNARFAGKLDVGEHVAVWGRIQSREYQKKIGNDEIVNKVAYEVSVNRINRIGEDDIYEENNIKQDYA